MEITKIEKIQNCVDFFCDNATSLSQLFISLSMIHRILKEDKSINLDSVEKSELFSRIVNTLLDKSLHDTTEHFNILRKNLGRSHQLASFVFNAAATPIAKRNDIEEYEFVDSHTRKRLDNLQYEIEQCFNNESSNSKCYIATMAYGDYDHPQVLILRQFRDEVLDKSDFGKWLIKTYYHYSPKFVEKLKNKKGINTVIRKTLNQFIKLIK